MANQMISVKIEGEEEQILQFSIPDSEPFGYVNGFLDDHHQYAGTEEIASLLGNSASESLTMYKCEPMDQEGEIETVTSSEGVETYLPLLNTSDTLPTPIANTATSGSVEIDTGRENSSSSSDTDDDDNSASDCDDSSADDESKSGLTDFENQRQTGGKGVARQCNRRKRFRSKSELREPVLKMDDMELEKPLEHFVQDNIEDYLKQRGFLDVSTIPTTVPKGIFASIILPEAARSNTIAYGPQYDVREICEELERFLEFYLKLKEKFPHLALELKPVLTPTLLHFFIISDFKMFIKLYHLFAKRFYQEDRSPEALHVFTNLNGVITAGTFMSSEYLQTLRHRQHSFLFSEPLFEKVKQFLIHRQSPVFVHLFTSKFVIQLKETAEVIETFLEGPSAFNAPDDIETVEENIPGSTKFSIKYTSALLQPAIDSQEIDNDRTKENQNIVFDKSQLARHSKVGESLAISPAKKAIYQLRNSVEANIPSIRLRTLSGRQISAAISPKGTMFGFGGSTSAINVCFSTQEDLDQFNMERKLNKCKPYLLKRSRRQRKRNFKGGAMNGNSLFGKPQRYLSSSSESDEENDGDAKMINRMCGHEGPVYDLKFHPKTRLLFSVGHDSTLRAWDLNTFQCRCVYRGHSSPIWCMDITDTGHMIVTGSMDTTARIWVPERTDFVRLLAGHYFDVDCVKFHPNEAYVATGSVDRSVRLWSIADGNLVRVFTGVTSGLSAIAFHESGKYIIAGGEDSFIRIWDIAEGETLAELPSPVGSASSCRRIALCQNMLAAAFEDNSVRIWNLRELFGGNNRFSLGTSSDSSSSESESESKEVPPPRPGSSTNPEIKSEVLSDSDSASSCSITEDELEPLDAGVPSTAVRLPAPKIIPCDSSSILALYYQDFGHLFALGSKLEKIEQPQLTSDKRNSIPNVPDLDTLATALHGSTESLMEQLPEPGVTYLPDSVRPALIAAGITRWPVPVERLSSSDDEFDCHDSQRTNRL